MSLDLDNAFLNEWINTYSNFSIDTAHENIDYKPTAGTAYAELRMLPNGVEALSLADSNETTGIFRVILRYPLHKTAVAAKTKAEEIMSAFKIGKRISYDLNQLIVTSVKRDPGVPEDGWYKQVVSISYRAFLTR